MTIAWRYASTVVAVLLAAGCSAAPTERTSTLTGRIHDIQITDRISPEEMQVRIGDEVRWINARSAPIKVVFIHPLRDHISCQNGFATGWFSQESRSVKVATIDANKYASLCFSTPGVYRYTARMKETAPGGEMNESGVVKVTQ